MSKSELESLEREVEEARARLSADLARLSSPQVYSEFKAGVSHDLEQLKQQAIDTTKEVARERATDILEMVTDRIAVNPAAAAAIGAGLAWRLFRHPPISTALIGVGLYGLLRSNGNGAGAEGRPRRNGTIGRSGGRSGIDWNRKAEVFADNARGQMSDAIDATREQVSNVAGAMRKQVGEAAALAGESIGEAAKAARETVAEAAIKTRQKIGDVTDVAAAGAGDVATRAAKMTRRALADATDTASAWTVGGRRKVSHLLEETSPRDAVLLGAAAVAIVTAIGLAAQRQRD